MRVFAAFLRHAIAVFGLAAISTVAYGVENISPLSEPSIYAQQASARADLRHAIQSHRDVYRQSCQIGTRKDCLVADLDDVEVLLMDIEDEAKRESRKPDRAEKIKRLASDMRDQISALQDAIKEWASDAN